jgi:predicted Zn-dependent protease
MTPGDETGRSSLGSVAGFEEADDPTLAKHPIPAHEPLRAARKTADKAEHLARKKQFEEAIAEEAVALGPHTSKLGTTSRWSYRHAGKTEEAEQLFRRLVQSNPEHVLPFTNPVALPSSQKRYSDAGAVGRQALKLHRYSFKANLVLGTVLVNEGRWTGEAESKLE